MFYNRPILAGCRESNLTEKKRYDVTTDQAAEYNALCFKFTFQFAKQATIFMDEVRKKQVKQQKYIVPGSFRQKKVMVFISC